MKSRCAWHACSCVCWNALQPAAGHQAHAAPAASAGPGARLVLAAWHPGLVRVPAGGLSLSQPLRARRARPPLAARQHGLGGRPRRRRRPRRGACARDAHLLCVRHHGHLSGEPGGEGPAGLAAAASTAPQLLAHSTAALPEPASRPLASLGADARRAVPSPLFLLTPQDHYKGRRHLKNVERQQAQAAAAAAAASGQLPPGAPAPRAPFDSSTPFAGSGGSSSGGLQRSTSGITLGADGLRLSGGVLLSAGSLPRLPSGDVLEGFPCVRIGDVLLPSSMDLRAFLGKFGLRGWVWDSEARWKAWVRLPATAQGPAASTVCCRSPPPPCPCLATSRGDAAPGGRGGQRRPAAPHQ